MKEVDQLLLANRAWAAEMAAENPEFFSRNVGWQRPAFLWIGCSDSRVAPDQMTQAAPGGLFVHRNIANLVYPDDRNLMAVLHYAINVLEVPNVVICGHQGCGGIQAALEGRPPARSRTGWNMRARCMPIIAAKSMPCPPPKPG